MDCGLKVAYRQKSVFNADQSYNKPSRMYSMCFAINSFVSTPTGGSTISGYMANLPGLGRPTKLSVDAKVFIDQQMQNKWHTMHAEVKTFKNCS